MKTKIHDCFLGLAVGDALGVPFEFQSRRSLSQKRCTGIVGYGTHNQPPGTWSDDSALAFCLAEALTTGFDLDSIAQNFVKWLDDGFWTPRGEVFDVGITTQRAIGRLRDGAAPETAGDASEHANGNGSLMRILPLLFYIADKPIDRRLSLTSQVSSITHRHPRSVLACFMYLEYGRYILRGHDKRDAYRELRSTLPEFIRTNPQLESERGGFSRILSGDLEKIEANEISSSGYVVHTLEAGLWALLRNDSYADIVLCAVNLGDDTDTTAAVAGGLAGLLYGSDSIPKNWIQALARRDDIERLAARFYDSLTDPIGTPSATRKSGNNKNGMKG